MAEILGWAWENAKMILGTQGVKLHIFHTEQHPCTFSYLIYPVVELTVGAPL